MTRLRLRLLSAPPGIALSFCACASITVTLTGDALINQGPSRSFNRQGEYLLEIPFSEALAPVS